MRAATCSASTNTQRTNQMTSINLRAFAGAALILGTQAMASSPAKADLFCYSWEKNCTANGTIGTSGNDFLGLPGGDSVYKALPVAGAAVGGVVSGPVGAAAAAAGTTVLQGVYENLDPSTKTVMKNPWQLFD